MYEKIKTEMEGWLKNYEDNLFSLQESFLISLLDKLKDTAIGRERGYASIKSIAEFQDQTPIQHYSDLKPYIDRIVAGENNILYPHPPTAWIQTSGSTGSPKLFPYNEEFSNILFEQGILPINNFIYRFGSEALKILEGDSFLMHASGDCGTIGTGETKKTLGFVSGWMARQSSSDNPFAPPLSIQSIPDWEERLLETAVYYVQKNLTRLLGVTNYCLMFLSKVENAFNGKLFSALAKNNRQRAAELDKLYQEDGKLKINKVWPNLLLLQFAGVAPYKYQNWIKKTIHNGIIFQSYIGSEGFYGFQYDINNPAMVLMPINAFYEFLDHEEYINWQFNNGPKPNRHTVADVKAGKEYVFCISNCLGFTTYIPGDIIEIVSTKPLLFVYSRRLAKEVNIAAEKMSEKHISMAIIEASDQNKCLCREYLCTAVTQPIPQYVVAVDFSTHPENLEQFATDMEQSICQSNVSYADVRKMNLLQPLRIINLPTGEFDRYIAEKTQAGAWNPGQMKLPHLTDCQDFMDFFQRNSEGVSRLEFD